MNLTLMNKKIERVWEGGQEKFFKLVGVRLDEDLSFKYQVHHVSQQIVQAMSLICRSKASLTYSMKIMLYRALVESRLLYCLSIWGGASQSYLGKIITLQKKVARVVFGAPYNSHTHTLFGKIGALQFADLYKYNLIKIGNRFVYPFKDTPTGFLECFGIQPKTGTRSGQKNNLLVPFCKNKSLERLCTNQVPVIYNSLKVIQKSQYK